MNRLCTYLLLVLLPAGLAAQVAQFTPSALSGCAPLVVTFDGSASTGPGPLSYQWDFGNGNSASGPSQATPGAAYVNPGTYIVTLRVTGANGVQSPPVSATLTVFGKPQALFAADQTSGCPPFPVQFTDLSVPAGPPITQWTWDFGDGTALQQANPTHAYGPGSFSVTLIATDANGCQDVHIIPDLIQVAPSATVSLSAAGPRQTCDSSLSVAFDASYASLSPGPFAWSWDFGDGSTGSQQQMSHTYQGFGVFDVRVRLTDLSSGCLFEDSLPDAVRLLGQVTSATAALDSGCGPLTVPFANTSLYIEPGFQASWDWGDGSSQSGPAPALASPSHTYAQPGTYYPQLTVDMGPELCIQTYALPPVRVWPSPLAAFLPTLSQSCDTPFSVSFLASDTTATAWLWSFGDGGQDSTASPSHLYGAYGSYAVGLELWNAYGCRDSVVVPGAVRIQDPVAAFTDNLEDLIVYPQLWDGRDPSPIRGGCLPLEVQFTDLSQSPTPIVSYAWDFGDGTLLSGANPNPAHTYLAEGIYTVSLTITTADGCVRSATCDSCIRAGNPPLALLDTTGYPTLSCCDPATLFVDQTQGEYDYVWYAVTTGDWHGIIMDDTTSGNWDFGTTVPVFLDSGQYVSTMFYAYNLGCVDSFPLNNWTMLQPPWGAAGIDLLPCQSNWPTGGTVVFDTTNTTYVPNVSYIDSVRWEFGDPAGSTSNELYPTFTYPDTGTYWITVTVWNFANGCSCRVSGEQRLQIVVLPDTTFLLAPVSGCAPLSFQPQGPVQNVAAWNWSIGPGLASASGPNPLFTLDSLGTFDLSLVVSGADGCSDTVRRENIITVSGVKARISADRLSGCAPFSVNLSDLSQASAPIVSRSWSLGDGTVINGNAAAISYTYAQAPLPPAQQGNGVPVILTLTDSSGCQDQDTIYLRIYAPQPAWTSDTLHSCTGDTLIFTGLQDSTAGVGPLSYQWHAPALDPDTLAGGEVRFFVPPGAPQPIYVSVRDAAGCSAGRWDTVSAVQKLPQAQFSAFPVQATCPPLLVSFTDLSQPGHAPIVQWSWDFGNGSFSALQHPAKVYPAQGSYGVSLTITDSLGCSDSFTIPDLIRLTGVSGNFSVADDTICALDSVLFMASSPNAGSYTWDFGDGRLGLGPQFMHTYESPGELYPALVMKDSSGSCSLTLTDTLRIFPVPSTPLPADTAFCEGGAAAYNFYQPGAAYRWSTGDTASALTLRETGEYSVEIFYPETGCRTEASIRLRVWPLPQVSLGSERVLCEGDTLRISAQSTDTLQSYQWNVPSVLPASETERYIAFRQAGEVTLLVSDLRGCISGDTVTVQVVPLPLIDLDHTPVCEGDTLWLDASPRNFQLPGIEYLWFQNEAPLAASGPRAGLTEPGPVEVWVQIQECITPAVTEVSFYPLPRSEQYRELLNCVYTGRSVTLDAGNYDAWLWEHSGERSQRVQVVEDTTYYFQVFNAFGCSARDSMAVVDACPPKLFVPTGFTPNEDGTNDVMTWGGDYIDQFEIQIFSRWGMRLFSTRDLFGRWDASYEGQPVPEGVYTWHAVYNGTHPNYRYMQTQVGTVTVLR